jgi:hypothetical protein
MDLKETIRELSNAHREFARRASNRQVLAAFEECMAVVCADQAEDTDAHLNSSTAISSSSASRKRKLEAKDKVDVVMVVDPKNAISLCVESSSELRSVHLFKELLWEELHAVHWKDVSTDLKCLYAFATYLFVTLLDMYLSVKLTESEKTDQLSAFTQEIITVADRGAVYPFICMLELVTLSLIWMLGLLLSGRGLCMKLLIEFIESKKHHVLLRQPHITPVAAQVKTQYDLQVGVTRSLKLSLPLRTDYLSEAEFLSVYMTSSTPLLIQGDMDVWRAMTCTCASSTINDPDCHCWQNLDYIRQGAWVILMIHECSLCLNSL